MMMMKIVLYESILFKIGLRKLVNQSIFCSMYYISLNDTFDYEINDQLKSVNNLISITRDFSMKSMRKTNIHLKP